MTGSTDVRVCNVCAQEKNLADFYPYKSPWSGKQMWTRRCKACQAIARRTGRELTKDWHNSEATRRRYAMKSKAVDYKGGQCFDCLGVFSLCVYDFHHLDPTEKEVSPGNLLGRKWENIVPELDKCVLLCANCHRIRHHD
jgi:hypothetical protein